MSTAALENPYGIAPAMDLPQSPARWDVPLWSENYIFQGGDPETGVFFYHLIGRMAGNPDHWRAVFQCTLPGGEILSWKSYGPDSDGSGPATGPFRAQCVEPFRRWRVRYDGVAAATTREQNRTAFMSARAQPEPIDFDVMWDATTPVWSIGAEAGAEAEDHSVWNMHLEQAGVVRGHLCYRGERISFEGLGFRDHSVGPRELSTGSNHTWMQASFPHSQRHFGLISLAFTDSEERHTDAFCFAEGRLRDCVAERFPIWPDGEALYQPSGFIVEMEVPGHGPLSLTGTLLEPSFYFTTDAPSEIVLGYQSESNDMLWSCRETLCRYELAGEIGFGFLEISRRHTGRVVPS